jgi:hypothetical protein
VKASKALPCFLILLLASASVDDIWASFTPDPDDDVLTLEDNEFLQPTPQREQTPALELAFPQPADSAVAASASPSAAVGHPWDPPSSGAAPALLYVLMSLQR